MSVLQILFLFVMGLCVGSFLNVLIYRLPRDLSPLKGRSFCPKCKHKIGWKDNIPLLSFILLKGRCRYCHSPISWQYPLVELVTGIMTLLIFFYLGGIEVAASPASRWPDELLKGVLDFSIFIFLYLYISYSLIVIFFTDLKYGIIPDRIVFPAIVLTGLFHFAEVFLLRPTIRGVPYRINPSGHLGGGTSPIFDYLLAGLVAAGFFGLLLVLTKGRGMGLGDVKLALLMGLFLGFPKIIIALYLAFLTGALIGVILILLKKKRFGQYIPFGPFLVGGTLVSMFYGDQIWRLFLGILG